MRRVRTGLELASALTDIGEMVEDHVADEILKKLVLDGFEFIVRRSAYDTGFLRSNWHIQVNGINPEGLSTVRGTGGQAAVPGSPTIEFGDKVFLYNNTDYAIYLENGTPIMRAQPMVTPTYSYLQSEAVRLATYYNNLRLNE